MEEMKTGNTLPRGEKGRSGPRNPQAGAERNQRALARQAAMEVLTRIEKPGPPLSVRLSRVFEDMELSDVDRALATEWCSGVLRQRSTLEGWLASLYQGPMTRLRPDFRWHLLMGLYGLRFLDKVPHYAVVFEAVEMARAKYGEGAARLTNALLRSAQSSEPPVAATSTIADEFAAEYSHPVWLVKRWIDALGEARTKELLEWNQSPAPLWVRINPLRTTVEQFMKILADEGVEARQSEYLPEFVELIGRVRLRGWAPLVEGKCTVQDFGSGIPVHILDPKPGERVLDLCSAPGGKTTQIAERMKNEGKVVAVDVSEKRLELVKDGVKRLGLSCIEPVLMDGREFAFDELFDAILTDVPCSGTGVMASRADLRWRRQESDLDELKSLQSQLADRAATLLKPGGRLVYSTCSLEPDENQRQIHEFLERHPEFYIETGEDKLPPFRVDEGMWQSWPPRDKFGGTFVARLVKRM
ncbi:MAG: 16S rRNA (cytosine(967)-C(5))-methyltransferase RsmB [bacterium]|nr:16S rRNA (cytosine(967)-C(5))-methyltransferase RsmB [bacterium]